MHYLDCRPGFVELAYAEIYHVERIPYLTLPKNLLPYLTLEKNFFPT
jgi:hypothetical protein